MFKLKKQLNDLENQMNIIVTDNQTIRKERDQLKEQIKQMKQDADERDMAIRNASSTLQNALDTIKKQQDMLSFLYKGEMVDNPAVEFIGVKTYRNGWEYLMLHGKEMAVTKDADLTIWADHNEAIQVEVRGN